MMKFNIIERIGLGHELVKMPEPWQPPKIIGQGYAGADIIIWGAVNFCLQK